MSKLFEAFRFRIGTDPVRAGFQPVALPPDGTRVVYELNQMTDFPPGDRTGELTIDRGRMAGDAAFCDWMRAQLPDRLAPVRWHRDDGTEAIGRVIRTRLTPGCCTFTVRLVPDAAECAAAEDAFGGPPP